MGTTAEKISAKENILKAFSEENAFAVKNIEALKLEASAVFSSQGIPNKKHEDWKYANAEAAFKAFTYEHAGFSFPEDLISKYLINKNCIQVIILNGNFHSVKGSQKGLTILSLREALEENKVSGFSSIANYKTDGMSAMNTLMFTDGIYIEVEKNIELEKTIHILNIYSGTGNHLLSPRSVIRMSEASRGRIIETSISSNPLKFFRNQVTEVFCGQSSNFEYTLLQENNNHVVEVNTTVASLEKNSEATFNTFTFQGAFVRNNLDVLLEGENALAHLNGLFFPTGKTLVDNHTLVDHRVPNCNSNEIYKGIINDQATGIFNGKIFVRRDAQKTNAYQSSKNILMSEEATINTKPQLEIYADDVKCSHGSSTGKIDEEAMFYLRARGIGEESAKKLLLHAFAEDVVNNVSGEDLKNYILNRIDEILQ